MNGRRGGTMYSFFKQVILLTLILFLILFNGCVESPEKKIDESCTQQINGEECPSSIDEGVPTPEPTVVPTSTPGLIVCPADTKMCPGNVGVSRDPNNNCEFYACPSVT